jgi:GNAT superfamily N-acetyltransferase
MGQLSQPEPIHPFHKLDDFQSNELVLDAWLKQRAIKNHHAGASRTFVVHHDMKVIAYYCLSTGSVVSEHAPGKIKRNMPNPIPVMVLGRLAVDLSYQGRGIGKALLKDAVLRTIKISQDVGIRALLVHAISEFATDFYKRYGFVESTLSPMTLMLSLHDIKL